MFGLKRKKVVIPTQDTVELEGVQIWMVYWTRRYGQFSGDTERCCQGFTKEEDAVAFKKSLEDANKLIGNTSGTTVIIKKQSSGL